MASTSEDSAKIFSRGTWSNAQAVGEVLRLETVGGALLLVGAAVALIWANSPFSQYYLDLRDYKVGVDGFLHLNLSLGKWAADGLLAIFFFVAGLELKREFVVGELRDPKRAAVPIAAAACGVVVPALVYLAITSVGDNLHHGWAIPAATDIAFALAVLAVIGTHLPAALRAFLLTLAVVDDLIAIVIIAVAYTESMKMVFLLAALVPLGIFWFLTKQGILSTWLLVPLAVLCWALVHESGVHATIAGVALGLVVPVKTNHNRDIDIAHHFEHHVRPLSAGLAVPVFALFAAGVSVTGGGFGEAMEDPVVWGIVGGLVMGKLIGVFGGTFITAKLLGGRLDDDIAWVDLAGVSLLAGIGFTVSLLVNELAFGYGGDHTEHGRIGVLMGSLIAAALASVVLVSRNRHYRKVHEAEQVDADQDGIPDVYEVDDEPAATPTEDSGRTS